MSNSEASFGARAGFRIIYGVCCVVGLLPWRFLYHVVAGVLYFLLYRVARYRVKVVRENLSGSFPERSLRELRAVERKFYRNLSEYFIDAVDLAGITRKQFLKRSYWPAENRAEVNRIAAGRNWIALLGHYGSWEMLSAYGLYADGPEIVSAYRPLKNKAFDMYYRKVRNRFEGVGSIPMHDMLRFYMSRRDGAGGRPLSLALIADQSPPLDAQSRWVRFLNHPTVFFHGGEKIARKFSMPVFYMRVRKVRRGHWEQTFELVWDGASPTADHEITGAYARLLEDEIRRTPELWLWSHRRWKRRIAGAAAREYNARYGTDYPE